MQIEPERDTVPRQEAVVDGIDEGARDVTELDGVEDGVRDVTELDGAAGG